MARYDYDPYGSTIRATGTITDNPFGYAGQYTDSTTGLIYLRARRYDPRTAQFTGVDPLEAATGQPYSYALDNPTNATDATDLRPPSRIRCSTC